MDPYIVDSTLHDTLTTQELDLLRKVNSSAPHKHMTQTLGGSHVHKEQQEDQISILLFTCSASVKHYTASALLPLKSIPLSLHPYDNSEMLQGNA